MSNITNEENIKGWAIAPKDFLENFGEEGDFARQYLLNPTIFRLLGDIRGKKILDAGCGQGYLSRLFSKRGALVTGVEPGRDFINYAIEREKEKKLGITYIKEDLSKLHIFHNEFDAVVANMVFMDIPEYKSAIKNCIGALKQGGIFIFSISHPCFFDEGDKEWLEKGYVAVKEYLTEYCVKQTFGYSFHRLLSTYINYLIKNGCTINELIEPQLNEKEVKEHPEHDRDFHVPSFLVAKAVKQ